MEYRAVDFKKIKAKKVKKNIHKENVSSQNIEDRKSALDLARNFQVRTISEKAELVERIVVEHTKKHILDRFSNLKEVRNLVIVWLFLIVLLLLSVGFAQFFGSKSYKRESFVPGGTFSEGIVGEVKNLNPVFAQTAPEKAFSKLAFLRLFRFDTQGKLKGELAEKTTTTDNYKTIDIKFRKGAKWSDGQELTVDDVIFTVGLLQNPLVNSQYQSWKKVKVSKISDSSIKFEMPAQTSAVLHGLNFPILPKHILGGVQPDKMREDRFSGAPVTSGSFYFKSLIKTADRATIKLDANDKYIFGSPKLDRFEIVAFDDKESLKKSMISGEILASADVGMNDFTPIEQEKFNQNQTPINRGVYAFMNMNDNILKSHKVRQAIQASVDISLVRREIDSSKDLDLPVLIDDNGSQPKVSGFNKQRAIELLEEDGWKLKGEIRQKDGQNLKITIFSTNESQLEKSAQSFARQLKEIGFEVELIVIDKDDKTGNFVQSVLQPRGYSILIYEIDLGSDTDIYPFWHSSQATVNGLNFSNYSDSISDDLLVSLRLTEDEKSRQVKFEHFNRRWINNSPAIGITQSLKKYVYRKSVQVYDVNNIFVESVDRYNDVIYWQVYKGDVYKTP